MADYGNTPGNGPLRLNGIEASLDQLDQKDLPSTPSKAAERQAKALTVVRDIECGPQHIKDMGPTYLPQAPGESVANYNNRLERSVFFNVFGHTAKGLTGFVFRKDPVLGDDVPVQIRGDENGLGGHWENIDNCGTHGDVFLREQLQDAMVAGHNAIFVEYPATGGTQTLAAEQSEIRPYWIPIKKENILNWRTTVENGKTLPTQVVLLETSMVADGVFGEKEQKRYRVLFRDGPTVGFYLLEVTDRKTVVVVDKGLYPTQDEIPLAEVPTSGRKGLFESDPPLLDLAFLNLAHYRQWSDYDTSIHKTCVPIWVTIGENTFDEESGKKEILGASTGKALPMGADAKWVAHDGAALDACKQSLDDLKNDMAAVGMAMMASEKRAAETEKSKQISKAGTDSLLAITARGLQDGAEKALYFHARYLGLDDGGSIAINRDFESILMQADVMQAYAALVAAGFPKDVAVRMLQIGGRVPEDADPEEVAMEWDAASQAAVDAKQLAAEQNAQAVLDANKMDKAA